MDVRLHMYKYLTERYVESITVHEAFVHIQAYDYSLLCISTQMLIYLQWKQYLNKKEMGIKIKIKEKKRKKHIIKKYFNFI